MKTSLLILLPLLCLSTGCGATKDPAFWSAMSQSGQQMNQQNLQQQQQWQANHERNNALNQSPPITQQGRSVYNPRTGQYTYVPPGWNAHWDAQTGQWIVRP